MVPQAAEQQGVEEVELANWASRHSHRWYLGCILLKMPATISLASGLQSSQDASDIVADRGTRPADPDASW